MGHLKSNEINYNCFTSDNQLSEIFWLPTCSTILILNPKVGTVPRKCEKYLCTTNCPILLFVMRNRDSFNQRFYTINIVLEKYFKKSYSF